MKVGDLVRKTVGAVAIGIEDEGFPKRVGIVTKCRGWVDRSTGLPAVTVRFFDGKLPEANSYRQRDLEIINESR